MFFSLEYRKGSLESRPKMRWYESFESSCPSRVFKRPKGTDPEFKKVRVLYLLCLGQGLRCGGSVGRLSSLASLMGHSSSFSIIQYQSQYTAMHHTLQRQNQQMDRYSRQQVLRDVSFQGGHSRRASLSKTIMVKRGQQSKAVKHVSVRRKSVHSDVKDPFKTVNSEWKEAMRDPQMGSNPKEKCGMLEEWLNEALSDGQGNRDSLGTVRKFWLDRRHLHNTNVSPQRVEQMYRSLFVYSEGLRSSFQQLLTGVESSQRDATMHHYWDAFVRLLQNTNPIQTCFQKIEALYKNQIQQLTSQLDAEKRKEKENIGQLQGMLCRKEKELDEMSKEMQGLRVEFLIVDSTLKLTEESLNKELSTRLKFEEKINSVYGAYNEVKDKYERLKEDLGFKIHSLQDQEIEFRTLHQHLISQRIQNEQLNLNCKNLDNEVKQKELQIKLLMQELTETNSKLNGNSLIMDEINKNDLIDHQNNLIRTLQSSIREKDAQMTTMNDFLKELQSRIQTQNHIVAECRDKNDDLFLQCHHLDKQIKQKSKEIQTLTAQINFKETNQHSLIEENKQLIQANSSIEESERILRIQHDSLKKDYDLRIQQLKNNNESLTKLKEVKDKYERHNQIMKKQIEDAEQLTAQQSKLLSNEISNAYNLELQINRLKDTIRHEELEREKEKEQFSRMQNEYANDVDISGKNTLHLQRTLQDTKKVVKEKEKTISDLQIRISGLESKALYEADQQAYLRKMVPNLEQEKTILLKKYEALATQQETIKGQNSELKARLNGTSLALNKKQTEIVSEIDQLHQQVYSLKNELNIKKGFIHTMLYEDICSHLLKTQHEHETNSRLIEQKQAQIQSLILRFSKSEEQKNSLHAEIAVKKKETVQLRKQINTLETTIKENESKNQLLLKEHEKQIEVISISKRQREHESISQIEAKEQEKQKLYEMMREKNDLIAGLEEKIKLSVRRVPDVRQRQSQTNPPAQRLNQQAQTIAELLLKSEESFEENRMIAMNAQLVQSVTQHTPVLQKEPIASSQDAQQEKTHPKISKQIVQKDFRRTLKLAYLRK